MAAILSLLAPILAEIGTAYIWGEVISFVIKIAIYLIIAIIAIIVLWKIANQPVKAA